MVKIIRLGACCLLTHAMINLNFKKETQVFDWYAAYDFNEVNYVLNFIANEESIPTGVSVEKVDDYSTTNFHLSQNIFSAHFGHYLQDEFSALANKRGRRFYEHVKNNNEILFIRHDRENKITYNQIVDFCNIIKKINSEASFKILLLSDNEIIHENVVLRKYIYDHDEIYDEYIKECYPDVDKSSFT